MTSPANPLSGTDQPVTRRHITLLGDSVFDNLAYVSPGPDVISQLRSVLPAGDSAALLARDGAVVADVFEQVPDIPPETTFLIVSAGGNDALEVLDLLSARSASVLSSLLALTEPVQAFEAVYCRLIDTLTRRGTPLAVCTIYRPAFDSQPIDRVSEFLPIGVRVGALHQASVTGLALFNEVIYRVAHAYRLALIDLRALFEAPGDYATPIEPSCQGGEKIVKQIVDLTL